MFRKFSIIKMSFLLAAFTVLVFGQVLRHEFVNLDDPHVVYANNMIHAGITPDSVYQAFTSFYASSWVPLTWISLMLDVSLFGSGPVGPHLINLALHVGSSILLLLVLHKSTGAIWRSAAVAYLFALHPMHVQSVAWAAERKDVLSTFFFMAALYLYIRYTERHTIENFLACFGFFFLSALAKPMVITFPVLLLLLDWWPLERYPVSNPQERTWKNKLLWLVIEKIPFFLLAFAVSVITYLAQKTTGGVMNEHSLLERIFRAGISYVTYLAKMFWPLKLAVFYPYVETYPGLFEIIVSFLLLLAISAGVFLFTHYEPYLLTGWGWFLVTLLPVIGLVQVGEHSIADHYSYISYIGLFILLAWGFLPALRILPIKKEIVFAVVVVLLMLMPALTFRQVSYWRDTITLLTHAVDVVDGNWLALNNLGQEHLARNRIDEAMLCFEEAIRVKPDFVLALVNLGSLKAMRNQTDEAREMLLRALQFEPNNEKAKVLLDLIMRVKTSP